MAINCTVTRTATRLVRDCYKIIQFAHSQQLAALSNWACPTTRNWIGHLLNMCTVMPPIQRHLSVKCTHLYALIPHIKMATEKSYWWEEVVAKRNNNSNNDQYQSNKFQTTFANSDSECHLHRGAALPPAIIISLWTGPPFSGLPSPYLKRKYTFYRPLSRIPVFLF